MNSLTFTLRNSDSPILDCYFFSAHFLLVAAIPNNVSLDTDIHRIISNTTKYKQNTPGNTGSSGLSQSDQMAIGIGVPGAVITLVGVLLTIRHRRKGAYGN
jgi:hypothetical protein